MPLQLWKVAKKNESESKTKSPTTLKGKWYMYVHWKRRPHQPCFQEPGGPPKKYQDQQQWSNQVLNFFFRSLVTKRIDEKQPQSSCIISRLKIESHFELFQPIPSYHCKKTECSNPSYMSICCEQQSVAKSQNPKIGCITAPKMWEEDNTVRRRNNVALLNSKVAR